MVNFQRSIVNVESTNGVIAMKLFNKSKSNRRWRRFIMSRKRLYEMEKEN